MRDSPTLATPATVGVPSERPCSCSHVRGYGWTASAAVAGGAAAVAAIVGLFGFRAAAHQRWSDTIPGSAAEGTVLLADWLKRGVRLVVITLRIDFAGEISRVMATLLSPLAQKVFAV